MWDERSEIDASKQLWCWLIRGSPMKENALYKMAILIVSLLTSTVDTFATEVPFHLRSSTVSIAITSTGGAVKVRLTVKLPTPCHQAASWGLVADDGPAFSANSQFLVDPQ